MLLHRPERRGIDSLNFDSFSRRCTPYTLYLPPPFERSIYLVSLRLCLLYFFSAALSHPPLSLCLSISLHSLSARTYLSFIPVLNSSLFISRRSLSLSVRLYSCIPVQEEVSYGQVFHASLRLPLKRRVVPFLFRVSFLRCLGFGLFGVDVHLRYLSRIV